VKAFAILLAKHSRRLSPTQPDGNCLFRAISDQVYGTQDRHAEVRKKCCEAMLANEAELINFLAPGTRSSFSAYVRLLGRDGTWGGHLEMVALAGAYDRKVLVYRLGEELPTTIVEEGASGEMHLCYHERATAHYSSAVPLGEDEVDEGLSLALEGTDLTEDLAPLKASGEDAKITPPGVAQVKPGRKTEGQMFALSFAELKIVYADVLGSDYRGVRHKKRLVAAILDAWRIEDTLALADMSECS